MNLSQRLQDLGNDVVPLNLFLCLLVDAKIGNGSDNITENFLLPIVIQHVKEDLEEAFFEQVGEHVRVLGQVADQFDHEPRQLIALAFVNGVGEALLESGNFWLVHKVLVQGRLRRHVAQSDAR